MIVLSLEADAWGRPIIEVYIAASVPRVEALAARPSLQSAAA